MQAQIKWAHNALKSGWQYIAAHPAAQAQPTGIR
jgi:hypothetical protein